MCSKLFTRKGESGGSCSSPLQKTENLSQIGKYSTGTRSPLACVAQAHTILLIEVPSYRVQVFRAPTCGVDTGLLYAGSLHGLYLHQVVANAKACQYEWTMENDKTHIEQTTLLPLTGPQGRVDSVFSITREISGWSTISTVAHTLKEKSSAKTFSQILLAARETEKREVSKALHDEIGSSALMLSALIGLVRNDIEKNNIPKALSSLDKLNLQWQECLNRLRGIIVSLRPPNLDTNGALRGSMEELTQQVCQFGKLAYRFDCAKNLREKGISDQVKILLYRIVQEALNNVVKHAKAHQVLVRLCRRKDQISLIVQDDGVGFVKDKHRSLKHIGLLSMRDSVRLLSGRLSIITAPGKGTCIRVTCPCVVYEDNYDN